MAANEDFNRDKIVLRGGTYDIQIPAVPGDLTEENGDLEIYNPVTVKGQGPKRTRIDAHGLDRVFAFNDQTFELPRSTLRSLTVQGGDASAVPDVQHPSTGGGVLAAAGNVALRDVTVRDNEALFGGGIRSQALKLTIKDSTIAGNNASEGGGLALPIVLFNVPVTTIRSSTLAGNFASKGGAILADGFHSSMSAKLPVVYVLNSTVAKNSASAEAGGVMADNGAIVTVNNSTVAYNKADDDNTGGAVGGGIEQHSAATFNVNDSIVVSNTVGTGSSDPDCSGAFAGSGNVLGAATGCGALVAGPNLFVGSALIGPLADNGGPTKTIKLQSTSPALGFAGFCPGKDQRGVKRPHNNCDSGSYERKGS